MAEDRTTSLLNYIGCTLCDRSFVSYKDVYYWADHDLQITPDLRRLTSGWLVMLETDPYAIYVNFADDVPSPVQERLKTLIGHCVVEGVSCFTPWLVVNCEPASSLAKHMPVSVQ